jgi:hypothetical protein
MAATTSANALVYGLVSLSLVLAFYFLPTLVALKRNRHNTGAIFVLNLFLGWTVVGWVISLVWAVSSSQPQVVYVRDQPPTDPAAVLAGDILRQWDTLEMVRRTALATQFLAKIYPKVDFSSLSQPEIKLWLTEVAMGHAGSAKV